MGLPRSSSATSRSWYPCSAFMLKSLRAFCVENAYHKPQPQKKCRCLVLVLVINVLLKIIGYKVPIVSDLNYSFKKHFIGPYLVHSSFFKEEQLTIMLLMQLLPWDISSAYLNDVKKPLNTFPNKVRWDKTKDAAKYFFHIFISQGIWVGPINSALLERL